eukprot:TRINITY_DN3757_c0_g1_i1.p1 TRINITY_DN3757_c0_g1~~TRINITY_DN3757_c0_g1_i1.p1  ORF type:complete len:539 (+),score=132.68 TRINITY_DN3757_c0_g1_i1:220-1836(+)
MAVQEREVDTSSAHRVGDVFVYEYYRVLQETPEMAYKFYQDCSKISRLELDGKVKTVTTLKGIREKLKSFDYGCFKPLIISVDAHESHSDGLTILVTGAFIFKDSKTCPFVQSFFLAPQKTGYFVLNDVLRHLDNGLLQCRGDSGVKDGIISHETETPIQHIGERKSEASTIVITQASKTIPEKPLRDNNDSNKQGKILNNAGKNARTVNQSVLPAQHDEHKENARTVNQTVPPTQNDEHKESAGTINQSVTTTEHDGHRKNDKRVSQSVTSTQCDEHKEKAVIVNQSVISTQHDEHKEKSVTVNQSATSTQRDEHKLSYASMVMKEIPATTSLSQSQRPIPSKVVPAVERQAPNSTSTKCSTAVPATNGASKVPESEGNACTIYVGNLPFNATISQVEEMLKKFGPIKPSGVQIRSKQGGFCYGFVKFEEQISAKKALEASPMIIGGRRAFIEEKKNGPNPNAARAFHVRGGFRNNGGRDIHTPPNGFGNGRGCSMNGINNIDPHTGDDGNAESPALSEGYQVVYRKRNGRARDKLA